MAGLRRVTIDDDDIPDILDHGKDDELAALRAERDSLAEQARQEREARLRSEGQLGELGKTVTAERTRMLDTSLVASKADADRIEQDIKAASEAADYARVAALTRSLAKAEARILYYEGQKEDSERAATRKEPDPQPRGGDPVSAEFDKAIATLAPRAQAWLRNHKEAFGTPKLMRAHYQAIEDGVKEGSDDYFRHLDVEMGYRKAPQAKAEEPEEEEETEQEVEDVAEHETPARAAPARPDATPQRRAAVAAPSSREGAKMNGTNTKVRLTASQKQTADQLGQTYEQYWKNYQTAQARIKASGRS